MRLGNRTMNWAEAGRRLWGDRKDVSNSGIHGAERNALLAPEEPAPVAATPKALTPAEPTPEANSLLTGDPTQQLLTALGRFQRQVNVADSGAPAEAWVDNCMDQLITGIQIAHVRGWRGVKEALTDTARLLQSYDDAGAASGAVAFLQDAYEILCLMVGDLIVDNVRSGVMDKWRERYNRAVSDLEKAGHILLDDDGQAAAKQAAIVQTPQPAPAAPLAANGRPNNVTPFVPRAAAEEVSMEEEAPAPLTDEFADIETPDVTYATTEDSREFDDEPYGDPDAAAFIYDEDEVVQTPFDDDLSMAESELVEQTEEQQADEAEPQGDDPFGALYAEQLAYEKEVLEVDEDETSEETVASLSEVVAEPFSALPEEPESAVELPEPETGIDSVVTFDDEIDAVVEISVEESDPQEESDYPGDLGEALESDEIEEPVELQEEDSVVVEAAVPRPSDRVETAEFLFDLPSEDAEPEAMTKPTEDEAMPEPIEDEAQPEVAQPQEAAVAEVEEPVEESPQVILRNAQAAMLRGDTRDAKLLALQLAANMARIEAQKAVQVVQEAIARLTETEDAIGVAEADVALAEQRLAETMTSRQGREHDLDVKRSGIAGLEKRSSSVESAIAKLDEQIARLQAQREAELEKLTEVQSELEAERGEEQILLEDLDRIQESERAVGDTLDLARGRVDDLRTQRLEREQAREACEQLLARQRESAENIERTLEAVQG